MADRLTAQLHERVLRARRAWSSDPLERTDEGPWKIEEFLAGEEASFICICDGERALPFASSQDHKTRDDGDAGPNPGGMGAYSPAPVVTPEVHARVLREIIEPTLAGMAADGHPYRGFLYAGLMISADGTPKVIARNRCASLKGS